MFPYDYITNFESLEEKTLPSQKYFFNKLTNSDLLEEEYNHVINVFEKLKCKTLGDYVKVYLTMDVNLLADIMESFRTLCYDIIGLDVTHYLTLPSFSFDCMLKKTGIKLEQISDPNLYLQMEQGLCGGLCLVSHRYGKLNDELIPTVKPTEIPTLE